MLQTDQWEIRDRGHQFPYSPVCNDLHLSYLGQCDQLVALLTSQMTCEMVLSPCVSVAMKVLVTVYLFPTMELSRQTVRWMRVLFKNGE